MLIIVESVFVISIFFLMYNLISIILVSLWLFMFFVCFNLYKLIMYVVNVEFCLLEIINWIEVIIGIFWLFLFLLIWKELN